MTESTTLLKPTRPVGIIGYGAYVPRYRLPAKEVARIWTGGKTSGLPIKEKAVAGLDEDVVTMSLEAVRNAMNAPGSTRPISGRSGSGPNRTHMPSNRPPRS